MSSSKIRAIRRLREEQTGFTLVELLVAMTTAMVVLGGAVMLFTGSLQGQSSLQARAFGVEQARTAMDQIVRELHQGSTVITATASQLTLITYVHKASCGGASSSTAISCRVTYTCASGSCTRTERNPDGTGSGGAVQAVSGLASSNVFSYSPSATAPTYVGVTLPLAPQPGQNAVTLDDGAALGNIPPS